MLQTCIQCKNRASFTVLKKANQIHYAACFAVFSFKAGVWCPFHFWNLRYPVQVPKNPVCFVFCSLRISSSKSALPVMVIVPSLHPLRQGTHLSNCLQMKQNTRQEAVELEVMLRLENQHGKREMPCQLPPCQKSMPEPDQRLQLWQTEKCWPEVKLNTCDRTAYKKEARNCWRLYNSVEQAGNPQGSATSILLANKQVELLCFNGVR